VSPSGPPGANPFDDGTRKADLFGDDDVATAEIVDEDDTAAAAGAAVSGTSSSGEPVSDDLGVSDAEAVAEAVEIAQRVEAERDEYLDHLKRLQAEFENYKRRVATQNVELRAQAAAGLVKELLPVLDACEAAVSHGHAEVEPVRAQLFQTLEKQGLAAVGDADVPFDPNVHEAVMHEDGDGEAVVAEVLRTGYLWNDRVVRAAMVKVRG